MNPNFKPEMITPKLLKACGDQVSKYFPGGKRMDSECLFCRAIPSLRRDLHDPDCSQCPLGNGESEGAPCCRDSTFIGEGSRTTASRKELLARGKFLIKTLDDHGITIYDKEVK